MANPNPKDLIWPVKGALYLFYDDLAERWGYDPIHRAVFKVLHDPKLADTKTAQAPDFPQDVRSCSAIHLEPKLRFPYSGPDESQFEGLAISSAEKDSFSQFADLIKGNAEGDWRFASTHKAFGRFNSIQGPRGRKRKTLDLAASSDKVDVKRQATWGMSDKRSLVGDVFRRPNRHFFSCFRPSNP